MDKIFSRYKGRSFMFGEEVDVYRNLNVKDTFSIRSATNNLVLAHCSTVTLTNCVFIVREAGRQSTIRNQRKEVHAFVRGRIIAVNEECPSQLDTEVNYHPYKRGTFFTVGDQKSVYKSSLVHLEGKSCMVSAAEQSELAFETLDLFMEA